MIPIITTQAMRRRGADAMFQELKRLIAERNR